MKKREELREVIENYKSENGKEYKRLIISKKFYNKLCEELVKTDPKKHIRKIRSVIFDFKNMEIKEGVNFDYKLLP